jgi:hypothetical protein
MLLPPCGLNLIIARAVYQQLGFGLRILTARFQPAGGVLPAGWEGELHCPHMLAGAVAWLDD